MPRKLSQLSPNAQSYLLLGLITLIGAILRLSQLGAWSFWEDEILTMLRARSVFQDVLNDVSVVVHLLTREQLTRILVYFPLKLGGMTEFNARLMPAIVGMLSVPILYFPIERLYNKRVALLAVALLAVSPWHLFWSQNARFYVLLMLIFTLALFAFIVGIEKDDQRYLAASVLLLYLATRERLFAMFFVPIVAAYWGAIWILPWEKPAGFRFRNLLIVMVPAFLIAVFLAWEFVQAPAAWGATFSQVNVPEESEAAAQSVIASEAAASTWLINPVERFYSFVQEVSVPIFFLGLLGIGYAVVNKRRLEFFFGVAALVPILSIMVLSTVQFAATRYAFVSLVFWMILSSVTILQFLSQRERRGQLLVAGLVGILFLSLINADILYYTYQDGGRRNWRDAFVMVEEQRQPEDLVVTNAHAMGVFYAGDHVIEIANIEPEFIAESPHPVWIVHNRRRIEPTMYAWIEENAELIEVLDVHITAGSYEMRVYRYDPTEKVVADR